MKKIVGSFENWFPSQHPIHYGVPQRGLILQFLLSPPEATGLDGSPVQAVVNIELNGNAEIPRDTKIFANDELRPFGSYYLVTLFTGYGCGWDYFRIEGESPIHVRNWICLGDYPELEMAS